MIVGTYVGPPVTVDTETELTEFDVTVVVDADPEVGLVDTDPEVGLVDADPEVGLVLLI